MSAATGLYRPSLEARFAVEDLLHAYVECLDHDRLEDWPDFFVADCVYRIVPYENDAQNLPVSLIYTHTHMHVYTHMYTCTHTHVRKWHYHMHYVHTHTLPLSTSYMQEQSLHLKKSPTF